MCVAPPPTNGRASPEEAKQATPPDSPVATPPATNGDAIGPNVTEEVQEEVAQKENGVDKEVQDKKVEELYDIPVGKWTLWFGPRSGIPRMGMLLLTLVLVFCSDEGKAFGFVGKRPVLLDPCWRFRFR